MLALLLTLCALAGLGRPAVADVPLDPAEYHEQAIASYRAGDYASADALWRELLTADALTVEELDRASVHYNLGNVAWRRDQPLAAAAWYTACIRLDPRNPDAWANLEHVRAAAGVGPADRGDLRSTLQRILRSLTLAESQWLALGAGLLFAAALALEALRGGARNRRLAMVAGVLLALSLAPWVTHLSRGEELDLMVVSTGGGAVRSEPKPGAAVVGQFPAGSEVQQVDSLPGWVRARAGELEGWIESDAVQALEAPWTVRGATAADPGGA